MKYKNIYILLITITLLGIISWSVNYLFLNNDLLYFQSYGNQLSITSIEQIITFSKKWQWIGYIILPIVIMLRTKN